MRKHPDDVDVLPYDLIIHVGKRKKVQAIVKARYRQASAIGHQKTAHSPRHSSITNTIRHRTTPMHSQAITRRN